MKITVTQQHIDAGQKGEMCGCPISLAVKEALSADRVFAGMRSYIWLPQAFPAVCVQTGNSSRDYRISRRVAKFALDFDNGKEVKPFSFRLMKV